MARPRCDDFVKQVDRPDEYTCFSAKPCQLVGVRRAPLFRDDAQIVENEAVRVVVEMLAAEVLAD